MNTKYIFPCALMALDVAASNFLCSMGTALWVWLDIQ